MRNFLSRTVFALILCLLVGQLLSQATQITESTEPLQNGDHSRVASLSISYLGNMGVLVASQGKVVVIDGLHNEYKPAYAYPSNSTIKALTSGEYQDYKVADAVLVSHYHKDHFDPAISSAFLAQNPTSVTVGGQQVAEQTQESAQASEQVKVVPYNGETFTLEEEGLKIEAFKCPHVNAARHGKVENVAYLVYLGKHTILHLGDSNWDVAEKVLKERKLVEKTLDVAILPYWMLTSERSIQKAKDLLGARRIIATHLPPGFEDVEFIDLIKSYPNIEMFRVLNERRYYD